MPKGHHSVNERGLLRPAAVAKGHRSWWVGGVAALHLVIIVGLGCLLKPTQTPPASTSIALQLASVPAPVKPAISTPTPATSPVRPTPHPPSVAPAHPKPAAPAVRHHRNSSSGSKAPPSSRPSVPPAGDMLGNALADIHQQGWQSTSQHYAEDGGRNVQSALARYRQDWVRAVQMYVDLHFPKTHRNTRLEFSVTVDRLGRLIGLDMVHSTGDAALDAQAFSTVRAAAPFRPFDAGMGNRQTLTFRQGWVFNRGALLEP